MVVFARRGGDDCGPNARLALYTKALQIFMDDAAAVPLYQQVDIYGVSKRVRFQALSSEQLVGPWISLSDQKS
jgi:ABC-type transport system substrate-binding protein